MQSRRAANRPQRLKTGGVGETNAQVSVDPAAAAF
jgi:hypothetical protein